MIFINCSWVAPSGSGWYSCTQIGNKQPYIWGETIHKIPKHRTQNIQKKKINIKQLIRTQQEQKTKANSNEAMRQQDILYFMFSEPCIVI
jgi:hypothetical protein